MARGRKATYSYPLSDGRVVGASLKLRGNIYAVQFAHPTEHAKYVEKSTGCTTISDALSEGARIVLRHYLPTIAPDPKTATWDEALKHLEGTPDLRPDTIRGYRTAVRAVRLILPKVAGPSGITEELAHLFKRQFLKGTFTRGNASDAKTYTRTPTSCTTYLRSLRSLWQKHWKAAGFVRGNPWREVPYPNTPKAKRVKLPNETAVTDLLTWLEARHPGWHTPRLFVQVKALSGCRTLDLCKVRSEDLNGNTLTLTAAVTKTKTARVVPLPQDLADNLHAVKGKTYLWERTAEESAQHRGGTRYTTAADYSPSTWRWTIQNLFREFNEKRPTKDQVRPHDLRARAITLVAAATQSVDATAQALGVDAQTARHYMDAAKAFDPSDLLKKMAAVLLPHSK